MKTLDIPFAHTTKEYDLEYGPRYESHHYSFGYSFTSNLVFQPKVADTLMVATAAATPWLAHVYSKVRNWAVWMIDSPACNYVVSVCGEGRAHIFRFGRRHDNQTDSSSVRNFRPFLPSLNCCEFSFPIQSMWKIFIINWRGFFCVPKICDCSLNLIEIH